MAAKKMQKEKSKTYINGEDDGDSQDRYSPVIREVIHKVPGDKDAEKCNGDGNEAYCQRQ